MSEVFLSYSRDDLTVARRFAEGLEREGFTVWWDQTLDPGEAYDHVTEKALKQAGAVVVLWSRKSVESRWVRAEATLAQRNRTLVPVMIEPCDRPIMFELTQTADLSGWNGDPADKAWQAYLASLRRFLKKEAVRSAATVPPIASPQLSAHKSILGRTIGIALLALLVTGITWWAIAHRQTRDANAPVPAASVVAEEITLAVLPFADLSTARDQESFSDGLTEEILNQLAQIKGLAVSGRTSSFAFKGQNEDLRVIAGKLGVANLLEGSIRKEGKALRITAQLINGKSGVHLWSKTYARQYADVFALQEEIARDVAKALSITLGTVEFSHAEGGTNVPEALEKFLEARALAQSGAGEGTADKIVELTREAVRLDPNFALAWFMLADYLRPVSPKVVDAALQREQAEAQARGMALTPPDSGLAQFHRGRELLQKRQWIEAEPHLLAAYEAGPKYSRYLANNVYVGFLVSVGRAQEAVRVQERLVKFDPLALGPSFGLQQALNFAGRHDDALAENVRMRSLPGVPGESPAGGIALQLLVRPDMDWPAVRMQIQQRVTDNPDAPPLYVDMAELSWPDDRKAVLAALQKGLDDPARPDASTMVARFAAAFDERDMAFDAMRRAVKQGGAASIAWIPSSPGLRADPRFKQVVRDLGLVEYWRASGNWGDFCKPVGADDFECH